MRAVGQLSDEEFLRSPRGRGSAAQPDSRAVQSNTEIMLFMRLKIFMSSTPKLIIICCFIKRTVHKYSFVKIFFVLKEIIV